MVKIFNNIDKQSNPTEAAATMNGWEKTIPYNAQRIARISDTVGAGIALAKMGTSIPTPFARVFLFNTAFEQVNSLGAESQNVYTKLVSECLDFIEFIFNYGSDPNFRVEAWNVAQNIDALKNSDKNGHKRLGTCLEKFARDLNVPNIYLFYYMDVLVGGSSPYTLVYTSPNWQRVKPITNARGMAGNELFANYSDTNIPAVSLSQRHPEFRQYLTKLIAAFNPIAGFDNTAFWNYVYQSDVASFTSLMGESPYTINNFRSDYGIVQVQAGMDVDLLGRGGLNAMFLGYRKTLVQHPLIQGDPGIPENCPAPDYAIASSKCEGHEVPLVLNDIGVTTALYVGNNPWQQGTIVTRNPEEPLNSRVLPGPGHLKYPYLTDADFLEDTLLRVTYEVNDTAFYNYGMPANFLLPLKPRFFEYFDIKDINKKENLQLRSQENADGSVEIVLSIPIKCKSQSYIELKKVYMIEDIKLVAPAFSLAVFPSYKLLNSTVPNIYSILFNGALIDSKLTAVFYTVNGAIVDTIEPTSSDNRTSDTRFVTINNAFDFIQMEWDGVKALAIPRFMEVTPGAGKVSVGVDFGTTNSYVCLSFGGKAPQTLDVTKEDMQVLTLNRIDLSKGNYGDTYKGSMGAIPTMGRALDREFVPLLLGKDSDVEFPYRTVTCENSAFANKTEFHLFGDVNIGFNFMKEEFELEGTKYATNIKWDLEDFEANDITVRQNRVKAFCRQVVWMLKNKVMLSKTPVTGFEVYLTFPYTMGSVASDIKDYWEKSFDSLMGVGTVSVHDTTESIAPFYYLIGIDKVKFTKNALNIDIGGGTTDMLFADVENKQFYYNSSLFAGNDLWGDGKQLIDLGEKANGFVAYFEQLLEAGTIKSSNPTRKDSYYRYKDIVSSSADLMSYIFRYDNEFNFISYIKNSKTKLMPVLFVHLGALVYHVAQVLTAKQINIPSSVSFSGMGAQYIKMISSDDKMITALVKGLLAAFLGYGFDDDGEKMPKDFMVTFQKSPKIVTAQGATLMGNTALNEFAHYGENEMYVYGNSEIPSKVRYEESKQYFSKINEVYEKFLKEFLDDDDITSYIEKKYSVRFTDELKDTLRNAAEQSFAMMTRSKAPREKVEESMFFWPLKNGLYEASKL